MASGEIDLKGIQKDLNNVDKTIRNIEDAYNKFATNIEKKQTDKLQKDIKAAVSLLDKLRKGLETAPATEGFDKMGNSITGVVQKMTKIQEVFNNMNTKSAQEQIEKLKQAMKGLGDLFTGTILPQTQKNRLFENYQKLMQDAQSKVIHTFEGKQTSAIIHNEFERLKNLQPPKIEGVTAKSLQKIVEAKENIDKTRQSLKQLEAEYANLSALPSKSGLTDLTKAQKTLERDIKNTRKELEKYEEILSRDKSSEIWGKHRNSIKDLLLYYHQVADYLSVLRDRMQSLGTKDVKEAHHNFLELKTAISQMKASGLTSTDEYKEAVKLASSLKKQIKPYLDASKEYQSLYKKVKPYEEIINIELQRRQAMAANNATSEQELRILNEKMQKQKEYKAFIKSINEVASQALTPMQRAEELETARLKIAKRLNEIGKQASTTKDRTKLDALAEQAMNLDKALANVNAQLKDVYKAFPAVQQSMEKNPIVATDKSLADVKDIKDLYQQQQKELSAAADVSEKIFMQQARMDEAALKRAKSAAELNKLMKQVGAGNLDAINTYTTGHPALERYQNSINAMRSAQQKLNLTNDEGIQRYKALEAEIRKLENKMRNIIPTTTKLEETMKKVAKGNISAVDDYVGGEKAIKSVNRYREAINGLRQAQQKFNLNTEAGRNAYQQYEDKIRQLENELKSLTGQINNSNEALGRTQTAAGGLQKAYGYAQQIFHAFGVFGGIFGGTQFIKAIVQTTAEFQKQKAALRQIVGDAQEANILFKRMSTLAVQSPMQLLDLNKYAKQLAAYRIETQDLYRSLKMLGDISVGVGADMDRLILAYGQVKAANYLRGQELRQFSEAGVNVLSGLQQYYQETRGITYSLNEIFDMISKRKVIFEDVDAVLRNMTGESGNFFNMQLTMSQTLYGQIQKLTDLMKISLNEIGESSSGIIILGVKLAQGLARSMKTITQIATGLGVAYLSMRIALRYMTKETREAVTWDTIRLRLAKALGMEIQKNATNLNAMQMRMLKIAGIWGLVGAAVTAVTLTVSHFVQKHKQAQQEMQDAVKSLYQRITDVQDIEKRFDKTTPYKERLALLQQLVEKAKEWNYQLSLPAKIDASNINEVFSQAVYDVQMYTYKVAAYRKVLNGVLGKRNTKKTSTELLPDFAKAVSDAQTLMDIYQTIYDKLPEKAKNSFDELKQMQAEYRMNAEEAMVKYGMTMEQYQDYFIKTARKMMQTEQAVQATTGGMSYFSSINQITGLMEEDAAAAAARIYMSLTTNYIAGSVTFVQKLQKDIKEAFEDEDWDVFEGFTGKTLDKLSDKELSDLTQKFRDKLMPLMEAFKEAPEMVQNALITVIENLTGLDPQVTMKIWTDIRNGASNLNNTEFTDFVTMLLSDDPVINKELRINVTRLEFDGKDGFKEATYFEDVVNGMTEGLEKPIAENLKKKMEQALGLQKEMKDGKEVWTSKLTVDEMKKNIKDLYKTGEEAFKKYKSLEGKTDKDSKTKFESLKKQYGDPFKDVKDAVKYYTEQQERVYHFMDLNMWTDENKKKGGGRTENYVSYFKNMIDFIKKLHDKFKELRKDFNEDEILGWEGAFVRTITSFDAEFKDMPFEFINLFKDISEIQFKAPEEAAAEIERLRDIIIQTDKLTQKQKDEVLRYLSDKEGELLYKVEIDKKSLHDEKLFADVQKMFDDYQLTLELKKFNITGDEAGKLFGVDTKSLSQLQKKLEDMREHFIGEDAEKKYREFLRKITELSDKAALETSKKYLKYLEDEYSEIAKIQIEYMQMRGEVESLPFDEITKSRIMENLNKEEQKKIDNLKWDEFRATDYYIEMFDDLSKASRVSIGIMLSNLKELQKQLDLTPAQARALAETINKLEDETINRDPFTSMATSLKQLKELKGDKVLKDIVKNSTGLNKVNLKSVSRSYDVLAQKTEKLKKETEDLNVALYAAKSRDAIKKAFSEMEISPELQKALAEDDPDGLQQEMSRLLEKQQAISEELTSTNDLTEEHRRELEAENNRIRDQIALIGQLIEKYIMLNNVRGGGNGGENGGENASGFSYDASTPVEEINDALDKSQSELKQTNKEMTKVKDWRERFDRARKSINKVIDAIVGLSDSVRPVFDSVMENLDYLDGKTSELTEAYQEFGDAIFNSISSLGELIKRTLDMIPNLVEGFVTAGLQINSAMGIIGLIAEAVQLVITLISAFAKLHDAIVADKIDKIQQRLEKMQKTTEKLTEAFDNLYNIDRIREFDAAILESQQLQVDALEQMIALERSKKKEDTEQIKSWQEEIEKLNEDMIEQTEKFYNSLGGVGSASDMKSLAEEWTDAWYSAFKETGDGLSGLEESFDEFMDNIYKKQILNNLADRYFTELYEQLNYILAKEGGISANKDEFATWVNQMQDAFYGFDDEAKQLAEVMWAAGGLGGSLDGLTASIQGMTEDTADIIAAYLNSIRFYVSSNNTELETLQQNLCKDNNTNPIIMQLKIIAAQTTSLNSLMDSVIKPTGHNEGGAYIKVRVG